MVWPGYRTRGEICRGLAEMKELMESRSVRSAAAFVEVFGGTNSFKEVYDHLIFWEG